MQFVNVGRWSLLLVSTLEVAACRTDLPAEPAVLPRCPIRPTPATWTVCSRSAATSCSEQWPATMNG